MKKIIIGTQEYNPPVPPVPESAEEYVDAWTRAAKVKAVPAGIDVTGVYIFNAPAKPVTVPQAPGTRTLALALLNGVLKDFIGPQQRECVVSAFRGEERQFFYDLMVRLAGQVATMPKSYETDGQGDAAVAHLHYFAGGSANWYITEKDKGSPDDGVDGNPAGKENNRSAQFGIFRKPGGTRETFANHRPGENCR